MQYERYIWPLAATTVAAGAGLYFWRRRQRRLADLDPGAYIYGFPLDVEEEISNEPVSLVELESEVMDEEMFPGYQD